MKPSVPVARRPYDAPACGLYFIANLAYFSVRGAWFGASYDAWRP